MRKSWEEKMERRERKLEINPLSWVLSFSLKLFLCEKIIIKI
jgi:hypothetical protein